MVSTVYVGRGPSSAVTDMGVVGSGTMRAYVCNNTGQHLWLRRLGARMGPPSAGTRTVRLAAYRKSGDVSGADLIASTVNFTASTVMVNASTGNDEERDVTTPVMVPANASILLDLIAVSGGSLNHGMVQSANPAIGSQVDRNFYDKAGNTPPDPFGASDPHFEGAMSMWAECHTNDAPHLPVNRTVLNLESLTPTFEADFRDNNGAFGGANDSGDYMQRYQIIVQRSSDSVNFWTPAPFTASSSERTANHLSRVYAGTTLVRGTEYKWAVQTQDRFGAWSGYSSFLPFTPSAQGTVTAEAPPSGKQETVTPGPFTARWTHATSLAMTHARIRIKEGGAVVRSSALIDVADVAHSAAPGTLFTISWAQSGFTALSPGGSYTYEIQGRDSAGNDSQWSNGVAFTVNASPNVPAITSPVGDQVVTTFPLVHVTGSDADDTSGTGLVEKLRIKDSGGTVLFTRDMTNVSGNEWEYQTDGTDLASFGTYKLDAYAFDGTFYSGGAITIEADAVTSADVTFQYLAGPALAIVAPVDAGTVDTSTPTFAWDAPTQTAWRLRLYDAVTGALLRATNGGDWAVSAQQSYVHPAGWMHNGGAYRWEIEVRDAALLTAVESATFSVVFVPPADVAGFMATPYFVGSDPWATAARLDFEASTDPDFAWYDVYRDAVTTPLVRLTSASEVAWIDFTPTAGSHVYTVKVVAQQDGEFLSSAGVSAEALVDIQGVVLSSVTDPATVRAILTRVEERTRPRFGSEAVYTPWGALTDPDGAPTTVKGKARWWEIEGVYLIAADDMLTAAERLIEIETIDATDHHTYCYRDERGRREFVTIPADGGLSVTDLRLGRARVALRLRNERFVEGVVI